MDAPLTLAAFAPHEGSTFVVEAGALGSIELVLAAVQSLGGGGPRPEAFSLDFVGPAEPILGQQILPLDHPVMGRVDIFVVPLGPDGDGGFRYEATFN